MTLVKRYIVKHWLFASVIGYMLFSCLLKVATGINITIPCLFKTAFGIHCPGCGLTSAFIELLKLNPQSAWDHNPLIFAVIPSAAFFLVNDFIRFSKKATKAVSPSMHI